MATHNNVKRIIRRISEEIQATKEIAKLTSWRGAINTVISKVEIQIMNRNGYRTNKRIKGRLTKKHEVMLQYFDVLFDDFAEQYSYDRILPDDMSEYRDRVWVCWWQGIDKAPDIVKICFDSIQKNVGKKSLILITEENYKQYVNIPKWVEQKYKSGIISRTHFSDILRTSLLAEHGGIWLDATFFCHGTSLEQYMKLPLWSIKRPDYLNISVASGYFATYSIGCNYENRRVFATIRDYLLHYWEKTDLLIDYLLFDYLIVLAQKKDPYIRQLFSDIAPNNPCCDELCKLLSKPFDLGQWEELKKDTFLFKLTWKASFLRSCKGEDTFYAKLEKREI